MAHGRLSILIVILCVFPVFSQDVPTLDWDGWIRPSEGSRRVHAEHAWAIPFYQAIPVVQGHLSPEDLEMRQGGLWHVSGSDIPAALSAASLWPDGTVRWLAVDGLWPAHLPFGETPGELVSLPDNDVKHPNDSVQGHSTVDGVVRALEVHDGVAHLVGHEGDIVATLTPRASYIEITKPKHILPDTVPDDERQYAWAEPLDVLNPNGRIREITPRVREHVVERDNDVFTAYRLRGDGGAGLPDSKLEWQLRVRVYKESPVVRLQMSWGLHWDPEKYALTHADWVIDLTEPLLEAVVPGVDTPFDLSLGSVRKQSDPTGRHVTVFQDQPVIKNEYPEPSWDWAVVKTSGSSGSGGSGSAHPFIGIGTPRFTRLGPNNMTFDESGIVLASWDGHSEKGLDLRLTTDLNEFGITSIDVVTSGIGVMQTLESSLVWGDSVHVARSLAEHEARRDSLWLPTRDDLISTSGIGPWTSYTFEQNADYFKDTHGKTHFLMASRDRWRWNGWANYGDVRTNFSRASNSSRGLHTDRWALHGRYGWRKAAGQPYLGIWINGLSMNDREAALFALDYALHVVDIDVVHGSFFGEPSKHVGGAHRRNKDHWSGDPKMSYTFSTGLYLIEWMTGHERIDDTLAEIREFAKREAGTSSVAAALAWMKRYSETHDTDDLELAEKLLHQSAAEWERRGLGWGPDSDRWGSPDPNIKLTGLNALYQNNFRLPLDGIPTLIEFYETTGDRTYLDVLYTILQAHGVPDDLDVPLNNYLGFAYLLIHGYSEEDIGIDIVESIENDVSRIIGRSRGEYPPRSQWNYDTLLTAALRGSDFPTTYIGWQDVNAPIVMQVFGRSPVDVLVKSPKESARVSGTIVVDVDITGNRDLLDEFEKVHIDIDGDVIYVGKTLPESGAIVLDTTKLHDGRRRLTVTTAYERFGNFRHKVHFTVDNTWQLVQPMTPPAEQGWFGTVDFLQTSSRSGGWTYATGQHDLFFGDSERLVPSGNKTEYLIWKTPLFKSASIVAFIRPGFNLEKGLELAVSASNDHWHPLKYEVQIEDSTKGGEWLKAMITIDIGAHENDYHHFRLTLDEEVNEQDIQIGEVVLVGLKLED